MLPGTDAADFHGALFMPSDGHAEPRRAAPAIAREAIRLGARLQQNCAARRILTDARKVRGVETERGPIRCDRVVVAGGVWTPLLLRALGVDVPQIHGFATASEVTSAPLPALIGGSAGGVAFRPTASGSHVIGPHLSLAPITPAGIRNALRFRHVMRRLGHVVDLAPSLSHWRFMRQAEQWQGTGPSPFERCRILEPERRLYSEITALDGLARTFHDAARTALVRSWGGALATTPDNMPIIGPVPGYPEIQLACGMYYGFTFGPVAAALIASRILGDAPAVDPALFLPGRFSDGRALRFFA
jgi:glycine/D-amino acid oxidase-like deaminating enzyme